jgi:FkbM family methyltransferase
VDATNLVSLYRERFREEPKIILDFGAHDLRDSLILAESFPTTKIYAFEANQEYYNRCLSNNRFSDRIFVFHLAISNENSTVEFHITLGNVGASSMLKPIDWVPWTTDNRILKVNVPSIRLDTWMVENNIPFIDLIWMDVQGAELLCLQGLGENISKVKMIQTEVGVQAYYEGHTLYPEIDSFLKQNGFRQIFRKNDWSHEDNVAYVNERFV